MLASGTICRVMWIGKKCPLGGRAVSRSRACHCRCEAEAARDRDTARPCEVLSRDWCGVRVRCVDLVSRARDCWSPLARLEVDSGLLTHN